MAKEQLNSIKIKSFISPKNQTYLAQVEIFEQICSTNTYLLENIKIKSSGTVCLAEEQSQGRGRYGRTWFSPPLGNIYCSLLWKFLPESEVAGLGIAMGVAVINSLKKYGILSGLQLKWPNDILFEGRKLAGILLERKGHQIVIGVGINLQLPAEADPQWISIYQIIKKEIDRNELAGLLINELLTQLIFYEQKGLQPFISEWRQYDALINKPIEVSTPSEKFFGIMRGIESQGALLLEKEEGEVIAFSYGEVSVRSMTSTIT